LARRIRAGVLRATLLSPRRHGNNGAVHPQSKGEGKDIPGVFAWAMQIAAFIE
jgi:hypothetical protein